jgi:hypothetical protein
MDEKLGGSHYHLQSHIITPNFVRGLSYFSAKMMLDVTNVRKCLLYPHMY